MASTRYVVQVRKKEESVSLEGADIFEKGIRKLLKNVMKPVKKKIRNEYSCGEKRERI